MGELWSPLKAAAVVFLIVVGIGAVVGTVAVTVISEPGVHDQPFARGQQLGTGVGMLGAVAGAIAYFVQARRRG
jgi:hypothetical protein